MSQLSRSAEDARLAALYQLNLLDTSACESFDRITRMAAQIFALPIAAVSLTDHDRQWFKSRVGVSHDTVTRFKAPCAEVAETTEMVVIEDFACHKVYCDSPLADDGIRFYAGAPLVTREGHGLGALCVLGAEPREASPSELDALRDLAAMVMAQIELQHAFGRIDPITALPNCHQFLDDLEDLARDHPDHERFAVVVDLARPDQVGSITRVLGTSRIDEMVREAAVAVRGILGPDRHVYHVAATQFAFLSPAKMMQAEYLAGLEKALAWIRQTSAVRFATTAVVGIMPFVPGRTAARDVLRGAHSAAHDARQQDQTICVYSADSDQRHGRSFRLLDDFGAAIGSGDQLRLVFQPRIDLATRRCVGAEALLRWSHPTLGDVSPSEFIPMVEQTAYMRATTAWVLDHALRALAAWDNELTMSINVSAANLCDDDFVSQVQLYLLKHRIRPERLELEITESAMMQQGEQVLDRLRALSGTGVRLAIDDFGTGYSSLSYLQTLPVHVVKIDQSFVRDLTTTDGRSLVLVDAMVALSHKLGYRVVAEGVETEQAAAILAGLGCEEAQGFFFAHPLEAASFNTWTNKAQRAAA